MPNSPYINRFLQPDNVVSGGVQGLNRYTYVYNSPIVYADSSGNVPQNCSRYGWCREVGSDGFTLSLTVDASSISANVYKDGTRIHSQFIDAKDGLCGSMSFAAVLRTQQSYTHMTGNQIVDELDAAGITTNWTGASDIAEMAEHFGVNAIYKNPVGTKLALVGDSADRLKQLMGYMNDGWTPVVGLQTDGGYLKLSGTTPHWIAIVGIGKEDDNWFVDVFNPVNDSVTQYSWADFYAFLSRKYTVTEGKGRNKTTSILDHNALALLRPKIQRVPWQVTAFMEAP